MDERIVYFFISRAGADKAFAIWVTELIQLQGKSTILQDEHFGHQEFMGAMHRALEGGARVVALLSPDFLDSDYTLAEVNAALHGDPLNRKQRLIPLRIAHCAPDGVLANIAFTDLTPERRQQDATALALKILRTLGFENPTLDGAPSPPEGTLAQKIPIRHPEIRPNSSFVGREAMLTELGERLRSGIAAVSNSAYVAQAVSGMGGVGKTVLAREYAWRERDAYEGVWWIEAETEDGLLQSLIDLGDHLMPGLAEEKDRAQAAQKTLRWLEHAGAAKPYLIVYDNVEDLALFDRWRPAAGAHVLLTTRRTDLTGVTEAPFTVDLFEPETAVQLLCDGAGRDEPEAAALLAEALGYLPLAIAHAAAYCRENRLVDFNAYAANVAALLDRKPTARTADAYPASVYATFTLALERVIAGDAALGWPPCPEAETLMRHIAFMAPDAIPLDIFVDDVAPQIRLGEVVGQLERVSLLRSSQLDDGAPAANVHRLTQAVMRARLEEAGDAAAAAAQATRCLADAFPSPPNDVRNWPRCAALQSHAIATLATEQDAGDAAATAELLTVLGEYLFARSDHAAADLLMRRALLIDENSLGKHHPNFTVHLNNLAALLHATNRLDEAELLMRLSLKLDEQNYGENHPAVATRLNNLAMLLKDTNRLEEAETLVCRALQIDELSFGRDHPRVAIRLNNLALVFQQTDRLDEAATLLSRALRIDEKYHGADHPEVAVDLENLGLLLMAANRHSEAEPLMRRALQIVELSYEEEHPAIATRLSNMAALLHETNRHGEAEILVRRALRIDEKKFGKYHPNVAIRLNNLARLLQDNNRLDEAEPLMRRALAIWETSLGADHPNTRTAITSLASMQMEAATVTEPLSSSDGSAGA